MAEECVSFFCYWGGSIVSTAEGLSYDRDYERCIRVLPSVSYNELVTKLCSVLSLQQGQVNIKVTGRYPFLFGETVRTRGLRLDDDDSIRTLMEGINKLKWSHTELYLEYTVRSDNSPMHVPLIPERELAPIASSRGEHNIPSDELCSHNIANVAQWDTVRELADHHHQIGLTDSAEPPCMEEMMASPEDNQFIGLDLDYDVGYDVDFSVSEGVNERELEMHQPDSQSFTILPEVSTGCSTSGISCKQWDPNTQEPRIGILFKEKLDLMNALKTYSLRTNTQFQTIESDTRTWAIKCKIVGRTTCNWRLRASKLKKHGQWQITVYVGPHTCVYARMNQDHSQLDAGFVASYIEGMVKKDPSISAGMLTVIVNKQYHYHISYYKAWVAKQKAIASIFGNWEESYSKLPIFLHAVQKFNPGTIVDYMYHPTATPGTAILQYVFWAFKPCIEGFKFCRPVLSVDGTHLYGKYKGKLLIAMGVDANLQVFPIAFAVVDEETFDSWFWFLRNLRIHVVPNRQGLCLISDRHPGLVSAVNTPTSGWARPNATHRFCLRHVEANFKKKFSGVQLTKLMSDAAKTPQVRKFEATMHMIKELNLAAWRYLHEIPREMWTMSHDGGHRYGNKTTNISECFNNVMRGARALPIAACAQFTFYKVLTYFSDRNAVGVACQETGVRHSPNVRELVEKFQRRARNHRIMRFNQIDGVYEITTGHHLNGGGNVQVVNLKEETCTCGKWSHLRIPCSHVIAVCEERHYDWMGMIAVQYSIDTYVNIYAHRFKPLHDPKYWESPDVPKFIPTANLKRQKGRPMSTRIRNEMDKSESSSKVRCGICREEGHNKRKCPSRNSG